MSEYWRIISGTNNNYAVSNYGNVKSLRTGKLLKPSVNHKGYLIFQLSINNKKKNFRGHRLVASAFIPNPENLPEVDHKNGKRQHNRDTNLRWVTGSANTRNREVCRQATSIYNGVHWNKKYGKWSSTIWFEGKTKSLGYFDKETDAALAFNRFCLENKLNRELNIILEDLNGCNTKTHTSLSPEQAGDKAQGIESDSHSLYTK